jgi:hypothetical protein
VAVVVGVAAVEVVEVVEASHHEVVVAQEEEVEVGCEVVQKLPLNLIVMKECSLREAKRMHL